MTVKQLEDIKVGVQVWRYEPERRVYGKDDRTIEREKWVKAWVVGENRLNWLVSTFKDADPESKWMISERIPKKGPVPGGIALTMTEIDVAVWLHEHRWRIIERLQHARLTLDQVVTLAQMVDYEHVPPKRDSDPF